MTANSYGLRFCQHLSAKTPTFEARPYEFCVFGIRTAACKSRVAFLKTCVSPLREARKWKEKSARMPHEAVRIGLSPIREPINAMNYWVPSGGPKEPPRHRFSSDAGSAFSTQERAHIQRYACTCRRIHKSTYTHARKYLYKTCTHRHTHMHSYRGAHACTYMHKHTSMHEDTYKHTDINIRARKVCMHQHAGTHTHAHAKQHNIPTSTDMHSMHPPKHNHKHICTNIRTYANVWTHTRLQTYIHIHIHT